MNFGLYIICSIVCLVFLTYVDKPKDTIKNTFKYLFVSFMWPAALGLFLGDIYLERNKSKSEKGET